MSELMSVLGCCFNSHLVARFCGAPAQGQSVDSGLTCWGSNSAGELDAPSGAFTAVSAGRQHSCGLRIDGTVTCWGSNFHGQAVAPLGRFTAISAGFTHSCGVRTDGSVTCWGDPPVLLPVAASGEPDAAPASVRVPGVFLDGAEPWIASDCAGDVPIVVGADAKAQSDIYSAVTLAGVVGTDCIVLAGPRDGDMTAAQRARLDAADEGGYVLGGAAAVPEAKIAGRGMKRLGGANRWATAQLIGSEAPSLAES